MEFTRHPATPENMARLDLSYNGHDLNCSHPGTLNSDSCQQDTTVLFLINGYLWPSCAAHEDEIANALTLMPESLWKIQDNPDI